jgi:hypothetical protein
MHQETSNKLLVRALETFEAEFGAPTRTTEEAWACDLRNASARPPG